MIILSRNSDAIPGMTKLQWRGSNLITDITTRKRLESADNNNAFSAEDMSWL